MKARWLLGSLFLLAASWLSALNAAPIALSGWSTDDIVGASEGSPYSTGSVNGFSFYQQGLAGSSQGLPAANNGTLAGAATTGTVFQLAPYAGNNTAFVNDGSPVTLNLVSPHQYASLQFLDVDANGGPTNWNVTLHFAGGATTMTTTFSDSDWTTQGAGATNGTLAFTNYGLVSGGTNTVGYTGYLYAAEHDITLSPADQARWLTSITITNANGGNLMFLAASGQQVPEPSSMILWGLGAVGLVLAGKQLKKAKVAGKYAGLAAVLFLLVFAPALHADTIALAPTSSTGGQVYDDLFGMDFNTNKNIAVTKLGVFDTGSDGVLHTDSPTQPIVVQLWNLNNPGTPLATVDFGGGSPIGTDTAVGGGMVFFQNLATPISLPAGGNYYISEDYSSAETFFNSGGNVSTAPTINDLNGAITFVGAGRASSGHDYVFTGSNGGFIDGGPANRYMGPDFAFVPEPSSMILCGLGAIALLVAVRRRRQA